MEEPKYEDYMLPILIVMGDKVSRKNSEIRDLVLKQMGLKVDSLVEKQKNGSYKYKDNVNFAISYLSMSGLLNRQSFGVYVISEKGMDVLARNPRRINTAFLMQLNPEFRERITARSEKNPLTKDDGLVEEKLNPLEKILENARIIKETKKNEILSMLKAVDEDKKKNRDRDDAFEHICLDLLKALGYGFDDRSGFVTKGSRDGGIDGVITGDKLGFERVAYQSKRWNNPVNRATVSQFVGDFDYAKCTKGVFITTSTFEPDALKFAQGHKNLILIDGDKLVDLMYEFGVGVTTKETIDLKDVDNDYFESYDFLS